MFEKEAEEAILKKYHSSVQGYKSLVKNWQEGAEFGYNKANEWHYVKDGDLPRVYQKCYFIRSNNYKDNKVIFSESNINVLTGVYAFVIDEESDEETTEPCFYDDINNDEIDLSEVYAWKEIVLPKLPKESE